MNTQQLWRPRPRATREDADYVAAESSHRLGRVLLALSTTGVRIGELADLRWTDIDLDAGILTLSGPPVTKRRWQESDGTL